MARLFLPEFYEAGQLVNQGTALLRSNQNKEAADKLSRAVLIAPGMAEAHHDYALALAKLGQTQPALDQFKLALNLNPNLDSAWLSMGGLYQSTGNIPAALKAYKEFVTRFPRNPDTPKVASLMQGLQKEYSNGGIAAPGTSSDKDYFAEATAGGFLRWPANRMPIKIYIKDGSDVSGYKLLRQNTA